MPTISLIEQDDNKMCLVFCGDDCTCNARKIAMNNLEEHLKTIIHIPKSNVRNVPIKKKR